ncbi:MAG TPA: SpoIID/LytB domain-containing protein [Vicinamibacteria bacterium]|nr:SpoIID/LytB domain-containing protein [Vicinamibacteria bacterium]
MNPSLRMGALVSLLAALQFARPGPLAAQDPPDQPPEQTPEERMLEENWLASLEANGHSHASGARPELGPVVRGNPTQAVVALRVGLYYPAFNSTGGVTTEFSTLNHPSVSISSTVDTVHVIDGSDGHQIAAIEPGIVVTVRHDGTGYVVTADGQDLGIFAGPVFFRPTSGDEQMRVESIRRTNILGSGFVVPRYRGALEVARGTATAATRVNLVNIVELESYVPGVVANESLASFHIEALKAQATAARGYAVANIGNFSSRGWPFDIVDSASSQVYRGIISEHPKAVQASAETRGLVSSYQGRIISALYSSSFGGHSESNEWIFPSPSSSLPGLNAQPYLRGIFDGTGAPPDLSTDEGLAAFWKSQQPATYDSCSKVNNRFSRWRFTIPAATIKSRLPGPPVRYVVTSGMPATVLTGAITNIEVLTRMSSSRVAVARITLTTGTVEVRGWDNLRNVLGRTVASTPLNCGSNAAASFVLNNPSIIAPAFDADGTLKELTVWGGGWGHNVGMSQYGSNGRALSGQTFQEILHAYYTSVDVGSYPIDIGREPGTGPPTLRQSFQSPQGNGTLEIRAEGLRGLVVHVNELYDIVLRESDLAADVVQVDLSPYLSPGPNVVQYNPVGRNGSATVSVIVD